MAKVTFTIEDTDDDSITAILKFDPPISYQNIDNPTHAIKTSALIMNNLKDMGKIKLCVNGIERDFKL